MPVPVLKPHEVVRILRALGFVEVRQRGAHKQFRHPDGLTLAAYVAGDLRADLETTAYVDLVGVGDILPDMPAYLDRDGHVPAPLEAAYQAAWATCPADMRELVETGKLAGEGE